MDLCVIGAFRIDREIGTCQKAEINVSNLVKVNPAIIAGFLALVSLPFHFVLPITASHQLAAILLSLVAGVYVGFAVQDGRLKILLIEGLVALIFIGAALAGLWVSAWFIPLAYVIHGFWDYAHHRHVDTALPKWYIPFCAVYDWIFAIGLSAAWLTG